MTHNLSTHLRRPRKLAEEQLILNVPANASGSEFSATTKIPRHRSGKTQTTHSMGASGSAFRAVYEEEL